MAGYKLTKVAVYNVKEKKNENESKSTCCTLLFSSQTVTLSTLGGRVES